MLLTTDSGARFSRCKRYRYALWRLWDQDRPPVMMIGLNPSTADAQRDDPTIRRCIGFARDWDAGSLVMTNLFAYRATYPSDLLVAENPVGPRNHYWLRTLAAQCERLVAVWGNDGRWMDQSVRIQGVFGHRLEVLRLNKSGEPAHPLYLPKHLRPRPWHELPGPTTKAIDQR